MQQNIFRANVEVIGRFIQQQEIRRMQQHAQQRVTVALSAGEYADALEYLLPGK